MSINSNLKLQGFMIKPNLVINSFEYYSNTKTYFTKEK